MSNDTNVFERLYKLQATIGKLVLDGARDPHVVASVLQRIIDEAGTPCAVAPTEPLKFALYNSIDTTVVVPENYNHATALARFKAEHEKDCYYFNSLMKDANFNNPSRMLVAGERLRLRVFEQTVSDVTSSTERVEFLRSQGALFIGAQGIPLVFSQKRHELPKDKWYSSFDEEDNLPFFEDYHRVPSLDARRDGDFGVHLGHFEEPWNRRSLLLCFSDL